jgi:hypothetical protein
MKVVVRDNHIVKVLELSTDTPIPANHWVFYKTVDELFSIAQQTNPDSVAHIAIEYNPRYGLPSLIYIDPDEGVADEEFGYQSEFLSRD